MSNNGNRPKLELNLGQSQQVTLLKPPHIGSSQWGEYFLYPVDVDGEEKSFFATPEIHNQISEMKLGPGDIVMIRKLAVQNGKRVNAKMMLEVVSKEQPMVEAPVQSSGDKLKDLLLQCVRDAADVVREAGIQFSNDELQKLATTLFIQRAR